MYNAIVVSRWIDVLSTC